jgi:hypothetical protein
MDQINMVMDRINTMLLSLEFQKTVITNPFRNETNYRHGTLYCIPQYIHSLGFLMEYADSYEKAKNHGHEDGDSFPLSLGAEAILDGITQEVKRNIALVAAISNDG